MMPSPVEGLKTLLIPKGGGPPAAVGGGIFQTHQLLPRGYWQASNSNYLRGGGGIPLHRSLAGICLQALQNLSGTLGLRELSLPL